MFTERRASQHYRFRLFYFSSTQRLPGWDLRPSLEGTPRSLLGCLEALQKFLAPLSRSSCALVILRPHCTSKIHGRLRRRLILRPLESFPSSSSSPAACACACILYPVSCIRTRPLFISQADTHSPAACPLSARAPQPCQHPSTSPGQFRPHRRRRRLAHHHHLPGPTVTPSCGTGFAHAQLHRPLRLSFTAVAAILLHFTHRGAFCARHTPSLTILRAPS
ncbi:hypothetical protein P171DRAFT_224537 [Karstenula rhodostoma CBS 690.94]|uniref:Uncharacterized protein n=1 Tax=Karstenula rhodostoma CBS 690.94 TaxID=1392251 RepID=A0A9P4UFE1_9PLEO|nr:hypothetical protein P171DRAFT_224537 [Karstenula rhodostoma CBS 690.94]